MNINWAQKLTSRKFWAAIIGFVTAVMVAFGVNDLTIEQVIVMITAASTLIAYILGEGMVDAARVRTGEAEPAQAQSIGFIAESEVITNENCSTRSRTRG